MTNNLNLRTEMNDNRAHKAVNSPVLNENRMILFTTASDRANPVRERLRK